MVQVFVRGLSSVTSSVDVELDGTVEQLKQAIEALDGLPSELQGIVFSGKSLQDECCLLHYGISAGSTLQLVLRLRGGKGGFGALLRGQGRDGKVTENFDACRDLSGRRVRHQAAEVKLKAWKAAAPERELERIALQHIKQTVKQQRRQEAEQVDVAAVVTAQEECVTQTAQAVQDAISAGVTKTGSCSAAVAKRGGSSSNEASTSSGSTQPPSKRPRMLACLEDLGSDVSSSDEEEVTA
ncbi:ubiquitin fusion protein [Haematococcus lacustris]